MKLAGIAFSLCGARLLARLLDSFEKEGEETRGAVLSRAFSVSAESAGAKAETIEGSAEGPENGETKVWVYRQNSEGQTKGETPAGKGNHKRLERGKTEAGQGEKEKFLGLSILSESLGSWTGRQFREADGILFIGAAGIAVRACAPFIRKKTEDPAVVVMDETGCFSISLLSGHLGGANELAARAAAFVGAVPVITTATDRNGLFSPDVFAAKNGLEIEDMDRLKELSASLVGGEQAGFFCDFPVDGEIPPELCPGKARRMNLWVTRAGQEWENPWDGGEADGTGMGKKCVRLLSRDAALGIGCRKNTEKGKIESLALAALALGGLGIKDVFQIASIDLKKEEKGLLEFARETGIELTCYSSGELEKVPGRFSESEFVKTVAGVGTVCERAAALAAGTGAEGLVVRKTAGDGVTAAVAVRNRRIRMDWGQNRR